MSGCPVRSRDGALLASVVSGWPGVVDVPPFAGGVALGVGVGVTVGVGVGVGVGVCVGAGPFHGLGPGTPLLKAARAVPSPPTHAMPSAPSGVVVIAGGVTVCAAASDTSTGAGRSWRSRSR